MNETIVELRKRIEAMQRVDGEDLPFALIAAACSGCCQVSNSGNGGCPPKPLEE